ncbi:Gs1l [Drosophila busckii]|uniref:Gs1l n=1 Tax=Drosophila busckii TaxID=30019 RepID=A0A0M4E7T2_DROBS|nr:pseudouridine-5'-phosphatase [Drosophila busckii]ALC37951.1 Gs1l [Drosophila busckii]
MSPCNSKKFQTVTHCIFDNDGTLMDTENIYQMAVQRTIDPFGKEYSYDLKLRCMGLPIMLAAKLLIKELDLPVTPEVYIESFDKAMIELTSNVSLLPGVRNLLLHLAHHRVPMAIATGSGRRMFSLKSAPHCNIMPAFHHIVCGCDPELKAGKPAPDIFLLAAARFAPPAHPKCCLVFEDSPNGLQAGLAAGMQVVMIPDPRCPKELRQGATQVLESMEDFKPEQYGLPPYGNCERFYFG